MSAEIRSEICAQYMDLSTYAPPAVMCWMKNDEKIAPMLEGKEIKKLIVIPNRLINIIL